MSLSFYSPSPQSVSFVGINGLPVWETAAVQPRMSQCWHCGRVYDLAKLRVSPDFEAFETERGLRSTGRWSESICESLHGRVGRTVSRSTPVSFEDAPAKALPLDDDDAVKRTPGEPVEHLRKRITPRAIEQAYDAFSESKEGAEAGLLEIVRAFAMSKSESTLFDVREVAATPDDLAQEVMFYIWSKLSEFEGDGKSFYSWLNRICFTTGAAAINEAQDEAPLREALTVVDEDGFVDDNQSSISGRIVPCS